MDEDEFGEAQRKQFHRQEAISAVADEGFLGDEDDEYDDLYNDVNVGEGFHHTLQRSELGFKNEDEGKKMEVVVESRKKEVEVVVLPGLGMGGGGGIGMEEGRSELNTSASSRPLDKFGQYPEPRLDRPDAQVGSIGFRGGGDAPSKGSAVVGGSGVDFRQSGMGGQVAGNPDELNRVDTSVRQAGGYGGGSTGAVGIVGGGGGASAAGGGMGVLGGGSSNAFAASAYSGMILFIGDLHWWTTDADIESEMSKYGQVKEVKFYEEKASGKSKGFASTRRRQAAN